MKDDKQSKIILVILLIILTTGVYLSNPSKSNTTETKQETNLENMSKIEINLFMDKLMQSILKQDTTFLNENTDKFTTEVYDKLIYYIENNEIADKSAVIQTVNDVITPSNSDTGDTVIMSNVKLTHGDTNYNRLYLLEFHINVDGKIYGYNIWSY